MSNLLGNLPAQLFSPFKLFYLVFAIFLYKRGGCYNCCDWLLFIFISIFFLVGEIWHNDYCRIILNRKAEEKSKYPEIELKISETELQKTKIELKKAKIELKKAGIELEKIKIEKMI